MSGQLASSWAPVLKAGVWWGWMPQGLLQAWLPALLLTHQAALEKQLHFGPFISSSCKGVKVHKGYTLMDIKVFCRNSEGQKKILARIHGALLTLSAWGTLEKAFLVQHPQQLSGCGGTLHCTFPHR